MLLFISVARLSWRGIFKPKSQYAISGRGCPVWYFLKCRLEWVEVYFHLRAFFEYLQPCFLVVYPFGFFVVIFSFPHIAPKIILLRSHPVAGMALPILPLLVGRIFFRCLAKSCFGCIVVIWMWLILSMIFNVSILFSKLFWTVPIHQLQLISPPPLIFKSVFSFLARFIYLSTFLLSLIFTLWSTGMVIFSSTFSFFQSFSGSLPKTPGEKC